MAYLRYLISFHILEFLIFVLIMSIGEFGSTIENAVQDGLGWYAIRLFSGQLVLQVLGESIFVPKSQKLLLATLLTSAGVSVACCILLFGLKPVAFLGLLIPGLFGGDGTFFYIFVSVVLAFFAMRKRAWPVSSNFFASLG